MLTWAMMLIALCVVAGFLSAYASEICITRMRWGTSICYIQRCGSALRGFFAVSFPWFCFIFAVRMGIMRVLEAGASVPCDEEQRDYELRVVKPSAVRNLSSDNQLLKRWDPELALYSSFTSECKISAAFFIWELRRQISPAVRVLTSKVNTAWIPMSRFLSLQLQAGMSAFSWKDRSDAKCFWNADSWKPSSTLRKSHFHFALTRS